ncbi:hypothetical protein ABXV19_08675 [Pseudomonas alkylphenolica]|uniref:hypothetical protein n=1 Tax=Pseudomonas alkylphenolica TaxID=237609 RepID=UPI003390D3A4
MPTENRSSNTEQMVSLPLDLVELALAHLPSDSAAGFELRELLAQPAAQHQREPYCWSYKIGGEQRFYPTDPRKSNQGAYAELMSDAEPLYRHPPTSDGFSAGDMADQGAKAFAARDPEVEELRAQLAEAQEVLRDCIEVGELDAETQWKAERVSKGRRLYVDDRALASIVDPSEPVESDQGIPGTSFQRLNMLANQGE